MPERRRQARRGGDKESQRDLQRVRRREWRIYRQISKRVQ
jgi:hypothetical protein